MGSCLEGGLAQLKFAICVPEKRNVSKREKSEEHRKNKKGISSDL
jgi:hypothetical protein